MDAETWLNANKAIELGFADEIMWKTEQSTEPTAQEPVSLSEAKTHLRIISDDEDNYIAGLISLAREYCENFTGYSLIASTYLLTLPAFPRFAKPAFLPCPPLTRVDWIKYKDKAGVQKTLTENEDYIVVTGISPSPVIPVPGSVWPADVYGVPDAVQIRTKTNITFITARFSAL